MALTEYPVNHELAARLWGKRLMRETLKRTHVKNFIGDSSDALIHRKAELNKQAGDKITFGLRMQLSGAGVAGDGTLAGNEEALITYSDTLAIDQLRNAVRSAGRMSEQRVPHSVREEAVAGLVDWWADRLDTAFFNQICGNTVQTDTRYTGFQATVAPTASSRQVIAGGHAAETSLVAANTFTLALIDAAVEKAKTNAMPLRPVKNPDLEAYVMFLHPYQVTSLRSNTQTGQWLDIQKAAMAGGQAQDNPIFTGALGVYNGVVLHESARVTNGVNGAAALPNVRRAVLCGAQAAAIGFGIDEDPEAMSWTEELFDYGNQLGVSAGMIYGLKKVRFNNSDYSTIVVSTYAAAS